MERKLDEMISSLSPEMQEEVMRKVENYIKELLKEENRNNAGKANDQRRTGFKFDWVGAMKDLRGKYTSVELQHDLRHKYFP